MVIEVKGTFKECDKSSELRIIVSTTDDNSVKEYDKIRDIEISYNFKVRACNIEAFEDTYSISFLII